MATPSAIRAPAQRAVLSVLSRAPAAAGSGEVGQPTPYLGTPSVCSRLQLSGSSMPNHCRASERRIVLELQISQPRRPPCGSRRRAALLKSSMQLQRTDEVRTPGRCSTPWRPACASNRRSQSRQVSTPQPGMRPPPGDSSLRYYHPTPGQSRRQNSSLAPVGAIRWL